MSTLHRQAKLLFHPASHLSSTPKHPDRLYSSLASQAQSLGPFVIRWVSEPQACYLEITHKNQPDFIWCTARNEPFLRTGQYRYRVHERHSSFKIFHTTERLASQSVDAIAIQGHQLIVQGILNSVNGDAHPYHLTFEYLSDQVLGFHVSVEHVNGFIEWIMALTGPAPLQGLGQQYTFMDSKRHCVPLISQEGGVGRGRWPISAIINLVAKGAQGHPFSSYCPMSVCHYQDWALVLSNTEYQEFDAREPDRLKVLLFAPQLHGQIVVQSDPLARLTKITAHTGRMSPHPDWVNDGAIVGVQGGSDVLLARAAQFEKAGVKISAFWVQDWVGRRKTSFGDQLWWNYEVDHARYPKLRKIRQQLLSKNIRLLAYINPMVVDVSGKPSAARHLYEEGREKGYFIKNKYGQPYPIHITDFYAYMVDLTHSEARAWYKAIIKESLLDSEHPDGTLFDGAMADFGEGLPLDACLSSGVSALAYHNRYPVEWAKLVNEVSLELGNRNLFFFFRAGFTRSPAYTHSFWCGDQNHSYDRYDGLHSALIVMLNAGLSGLSAVHSDIGGYTTLNIIGLGMTRKAGLLISWMEMAAFTAVFRTHEGSKPALNQQVYSSDSLLAYFAKFSKIYQALGFYRRMLLSEASEKGWPLVRQLGLHYPSDPQAVRCDHEFLLGDVFLVAPVLNPIQRLIGRRVYLPADDWVHLWTGKTYCFSGHESRYESEHESGQYVHVRAPKGFPPVFFKANHPVAQQFLNNLKELGVQIRQ